MWIPKEMSLEFINQMPTQNRPRVEHEDGFSGFFGQGKVNKKGMSTVPVAYPLGEFKNDIEYTKHG